MTKKIFTCLLDSGAMHNYSINLTKNMINRLLMKAFVIKELSILFLLLFYSLLLPAQEVTPSEVFAQVEQIQKELAIIKSHFNINIQPHYEKLLKSELKPRHAWQKAYEILVKINILRRSNGMSILEPINMEPKLKRDPILTYEMALRVLLELEIIKFRLDISEQVTPAISYSNKKPMDVFNSLRAISQDMDILNGQEFTPSYVFAEAMRIYEDINLIIMHLKINDESIPPIKMIDATPTDAFNTAIQLLTLVTRIEASIGIEGIDSSVFIRKQADPAHVYELTEIIIAELQVIKASVGIRYVITPAAKYYTQKSPADVIQLLGWSISKLSQVTTLR
jgi:hypothetical protein